MKSKPDANVANENMLENFLLSEVMCSVTLLSTIHIFVLLDSSYARSAILVLKLTLVLALFLYMLTSQFFEM